MRESKATFETGSSFMRLLPPSSPFSSAGWIVNEELPVWREREREKRRKKETYAGYKFTELCSLLNSCEDYSPLHSNCIATSRSHNMHYIEILDGLSISSLAAVIDTNCRCQQLPQTGSWHRSHPYNITPNYNDCKESFKSRQHSEKLSPQRPVPLTGILTIVSSPDPTLSRGEMVWWTKSNFLG